MRSGEARMFRGVTKMFWQCGIGGAALPFAFGCIGWDGRGCI